MTCISADFRHFPALPFDRQKFRSVFFPVPFLPTPQFLKEQVAIEVKKTFLRIAEIIFRTPAWDRESWVRIFFDRPSHRTSFPPIFIGGASGENFFREAIKDPTLPHSRQVPYYIGKSLGGACMGWGRQNGIPFFAQEEKKPPTASVCTVGARRGGEKKIVNEGRREDRRNRG